jgi:hypothetical protein
MELHVRSANAGLLLTIAINGLSVALSEAKDLLPLRRAHRLQSSLDLSLR